MQLPPSLPHLPPLTPVICGPTAGGKSDLAVSLALVLREKHSIPAEIVTADAFQVYQGLDIGTAKPTIAERRGVPHHLIDLRGTGILPVSAPNHGQDARATEPFTLDDWLRRANQTIAYLRSRNILPIVVGGTHLYIKALLEGLFEGPEPDAALRALLTAMDPTERRTELEHVDPQAAARIHPNDIRRTVRALEVFRLTGQPISTHQKQWDRTECGMSDVGCRMSEANADSSPPTSHIRHPTSPFLLIILDWDSESLNRRINARVQQMMDRGLLDEVRSLIEHNHFTPQSAEALGYKQLIPLARAAIDDHRWPPPAAALEAAVEKIKIETRRFGKNQRTWLRRLSTTPGAIRLSAAESGIALPGDDPAGGTPGGSPVPLAAPPIAEWLPRILAALGLPS